MNGGEVLAPKPSTTKSLHACCTQVEDEAFTGELGAPKRKAPTAGPKGSATKRKGDCGLSKREDAAEAEAAEKAELTAVADETMEQDDASILDKCKARYAQLMDDLFGNGPNATRVNWVEHPSFMYRHGQDVGKEEAAAEKAPVTDVHGEKMDQKRESILEKCAAEFAQFVDDMFGNGPNAIPVKWVDHSPFMHRYGQDYEEEEEEEELGSVDDGTPPSVSN
jgi:hypothetical protein